MTRLGDYWVQDNGSRFYNRYGTRVQGGFRWWLPAGHADFSERLADYPRQYHCSVVASVNRERARHRGSGILLHVNGQGDRGLRERAAGLPRATGATAPLPGPMIAIGR